MPAKKPSRKPETKPAKSEVSADASAEFGGETFNSEGLLSIRRKLRGRDFEIVDLKKIKFPGEDGKPDSENWYLFTDALDQGFKIIKKSGRRLLAAFGKKMESWIGQKVEIQLVDYGSLGTGADIYPAENSSEDEEVASEESDEQLD